MKESFSNNSREHQQPGPIRNQAAEDPKKQPYYPEEDLGNAWEQIINEQLQNQVTNVEGNPESSYDSLFDRPQDNAVEIAEIIVGEEEDSLHDDSTDDQDLKKDNPELSGRKNSATNLL